MKRGLYGYNKLLCLAAAFILLLSAMPCSAFAVYSKENIRVGFFAFDGYHMIDQNGNRSGYGYDLLQHMVGYTDWQYEYIGYDKNWSEMQDMLEAGEIDMLTSAQKTDDRLEHFDFSAQPVGVSSAILTVKAGNETYMLKDYSNWSGMRIGLLRGNSRNNDIAQFAAAKGFTYAPVFFDDISGLTQALQEGISVDAIVTSNLRSVENESVLAKFAPSPFYIMVKKGNAALLSEIDQTLEQLYCDHPNVQTELMDKYYTPQSEDEIAFTAQERQFINEMQDTTFTAFLNPDRVPLSYFENGQATGIIGEIAAEISKRAGLHIQIKELGDWEEYLSLLGSDGADICFDFIHDYSTAEKYGYHLTTPYIDAGISKLYLKNNANRQSAGLVSGSYINAELGNKIQFMYNRVKYYDSSKALVEAIQSGECDTGFFYTRVCERIVLSDVRNQFASEWVHGSNIDFCIAVKAGSDPRFFSILDKAAASLDDGLVESIVRKYSAYDATSDSIIKFIYDKPLVFVFFVAVLFAVIVLTTLIVLSAKRRRLDEKRLAEEVKRNALLSDALAAAKMANEAKSSFLSQMSHEMRTPLNAVIGFMALAKDTPSEQRNTYMENAMAAAKHLLSIINDVLDMSAISTGKLKIANAPFDFEQIIKHIETIYAPQCKAKGVEFKVISETPVDKWLTGDMLRLNQVLMNLLSNAVKFTDRGFVQLAVSQRSAQNGKIFIHFVVSDSGCGMSESMLSRIGKPFEQENAQTARKHGGSGLGLSIVKMLVSLMDGAFKAESTEGAGSIFTVDLPFGKEEARACPQPDKMQHDFSGKRVLLAEDNAMNRMVAEALVKKLGVMCETADDGKIAFDMFAASAYGYYDAILMDIQMPNMDGYNATKAIRQSGRPDAKRIAIVALSANAFNEDVAKSISVGMDDHVAKPIDVDKLTAALERAFTKNRE